jgi:SAM-dependent methyltransferase
MALVNLQPAIQACRALANAAWPTRLDAAQLFGTGALQALEADTLLHAVLQAAQISDVQTERFLTQCRSALLGLALHEANNPTASGPSAFCAALAQQCFVNDYVFSTTPEEDLGVERLRTQLTAALDNGSSVPDLWPLVLALYAPLGSVPGAQRLLELPGSTAVQAVLRQQIQEPRTEFALRASISAITPIDDSVSVLVQNQYEESPYPRWVQLPRHCVPEPIEATLRRILPGAPLQALPHPEPADAPASILVAGCGTGQQAIECALRFAQARVLAIDLSLSSLAYAQRKTLEMAQQAAPGMDWSRLRYAQADLLQLGTLDQRFDLIESCGVLHHLNDPLQGWRVLLSLLRPGGVMKLGFYSEIARRQVVRVRQWIADQGHTTSLSDIRACRQQLMAMELDAKAPENFGMATQSSDFFATSTCRDLLFHVQEHRTSLTAIAAFLQDNGLVFLGFETEPHVVNAYKARFPNDPAATNLAQWQVFENDNPDVFFNMYQFWIQKPLQG